MFGFVRLVYERADDDSVFRLVIFANTPSYIDIINIHVFDCDSTIQWA